MTFPLMVLIKTFDWSSFCSQMPNTVLNRLSVSADVLTLFSLYGAVFGSKCLLLLLLCKYGPCCIWSLLSESIFVHQTILNHKICAVDLCGRSHCENLSVPSSWSIACGAPSSVSSFTSHNPLCAC